jgi:transposase
MDDCLPIESLSEVSLRSLLTSERGRRQELEQEVLRLQAGVARQNAVIIQLERRDAERQREMAELRILVTGLTEQNALLRQQVANLEQECARLRGEPLGKTPAPVPEQKAATPPREKKGRKKRDASHNRGRHRMGHANRWVNHAVEQCPQCGEQLDGGWIDRRVQVIDLPSIAPLEITEHRMFRRRCHRCGKQILAPVAGQDVGRIGQSRFGPRLIAALTVMATVERLPIRLIQSRLRREYGLTISIGGITGLLQRMADTAMPTYDQLRADVQASGVVHADETGWRENGQHPALPSGWAPAVWTVSTTQTVYVHHGRRTNEHIDTILGPEYGGTIVADCYASYDHFLGPKQRCWAHLVRNLEELLAAQTENVETVAWVEGMLSVYEQARAPRPPPEEGWTPQAIRARDHRARQCEGLIILLCPAEPDPTLPYATLAKRLRKYLPELFTFIRDPAVPPTNNAAERSLRPLVIARKISGGTRSATGSTTRMVLYSVCATARMQEQDAAAICQQLLLAPPSAPSPLAAT